MLSIAIAKSLYNLQRYLFVSAATLSAQQPQTSHVYYLLQWFSRCWVTGSQGHTKEEVSRWISAQLALFRVVDYSKFESLKSDGAD